VLAGLSALIGLPAPVAADTRTAPLQITAEVVRSCQVSTGDAGVRLSCARAARPAVSAAGTTASGTEVSVTVSAQGDHYRVSAPPAEPEERGSGPSESWTASDPVIAVVVNVRL
jgi:hypothetical protein